MRGMKKGLGTGVVMVTTMATILEAEEVVQGVGEVDEAVVGALTIEGWINFEVVAEVDGEVSTTGVGEDLMIEEGEEGEGGTRGEASEGAMVTMTSEVPVGDAVEVEAGVVEMIALIGGTWTMSGQKTLLMTLRSLNSNLMEGE